MSRYIDMYGKTNQMVAIFTRTCGIPEKNIMNVLVKIQAVEWFPIALVLKKDQLLLIQKSDLVILKLIQSLAPIIKVAAALDIQVFFARPYHSRERGLNEHTNGLVRQYIPKKTIFGTLDGFYACSKCAKQA